MPPPERFWLNNEKGLPPGANQPGQEHKACSIGLGASRSFQLPMEYAELVALEGVFRHELGPASAKSAECCERQRGSEQLCPPSKARAEHVQAAPKRPVEMRKKWVHNMNFSFTKMC
jgi:hypothetical protein